MKTGDKFYSYEELEQGIKNYGDATLQCFVKTDTITLDSWLKNKKTEVVIEDSVKEKIVYQKCIFKCIHHGKSEHASKGKAVRTACAYNGKDCKVAINVCLFL